MMFIYQMKHVVFHGFMYYLLSNTTREKNGVKILKFLRGKFKSYSYWKNQRNVFKKSEFITMLIF